MNNYYKNTKDFLSKQAVGAAGIVTFLEKEISSYQSKLKEAKESLAHWQREIDKYQSQIGEPVVDWNLLVNKKGGDRE